VALNPKFIGRVYPSTSTYQVSREKIREFASAIGDRNPAFHDVAAAQVLGYADLVAPPTFSIILSMRASESVVFDPELGLDYTRVVHGEQRFSLARPIVAGDELLVQTTIDGIRTMAGNDMITTRADFTTVAGEHVGSATSLLVSRAPQEP
jgi:acyl dehydratase